MVSKPKYCDYCGCVLEHVGNVKNTISYKCPQCFSEKNIFNDTSVCKHEYDQRNNEKCIHCGK